MEVLDEQSKGVDFNAEIKEYLNETAKWAKFLAIMGYIGVGILVILALVVMIGMSQVNNMYSSAMPTTIIGILYLGFAALYYFPVNYLYKFAVGIKDGLENNDSEDTTRGFENLKSMFKFMGIFTIVILSMYALIIVFAIIGALAR